MDIFHCRDRLIKSYPVQGQSFLVAKYPHSHGPVHSKLDEPLMTIRTEKALNDNSRPLRLSSYAEPGALTVKKRSNHSPASRTSSRKSLITNVPIVHYSLQNSSCRRFNTILFYTAYNEYRPKRVILEIYDEMAACKSSGREYQTKLDPPPGDRRAGHK